MYLINFIKRCLGLHVHDWEAWKYHSIENVDIFADRVKWIDKYQQRKCKTCGYIQQKELRY